MRSVVTVAAAVCVAASVRAVAAEPPALVTLTEGEPASLLRGTARYALAEGVRLQTGDIIEVGQKGLAQIEFADGVMISLGPQSRFYAGALVVRDGKGGGISELYLMRGWSKIASGKSAGPYRYTTPIFGIGTSDATAVLQVQAAEGAIFLEVGELRLAEGFAKATVASPVQLRSGQFYTRKADDKGVIQPRAGGSFMSAMPKNYYDNLPARTGKFRDREVPPRRVGELTYADVEAWLKAPLSLRRQIMQRFIPKADDPVFRQALIANLKAHPEWERILFPDKNRPKPPPTQPAATKPVHAQSDQDTQRAPTEGGTPGLAPSRP